MFQSHVLTSDEPSFDMIHTLVITKNKYDYFVVLSAKNIRPIRNKFYTPVIVKTLYENYSEVHPSYSIQFLQIFFQD